MWILCSLNVSMLLLTAVCCFNSQIYCLSLFTSWILRISSFSHPVPAPKPAAPSMDPPKEASRLNTRATMMWIGFDEVICAQFFYFWFEWTMLVIICTFRRHNSPIQVVFYSVSYKFWNWLLKRIVGPDSNNHEPKRGSEFIEGKRTSWAKIE